MLTWRRIRWLVTEAMLLPAWLVLAPLFKIIGPVVLWTWPFRVLLHRPDYGQTIMLLDMDIAARLLPTHILAALERGLQNDSVRYRRPYYQLPEPLDAGVGPEVPFLAVFDGEDFTGELADLELREHALIKLYWLNRAEAHTGRARLIQVIRTEFRRRRWFGRMARWVP